MSFWCRLICRTMVDVSFQINCNNISSRMLHVNWTGGVEGGMFACCLSTTCPLSCGVDGSICIVQGMARARTVHDGPLRSNYCPVVFKGWYALPVWTARLNGPSRCLFSTAVETGSAYRTPIQMGRRDSGQEKALSCNAFLLNSPFERLVHTGSRSNGPFSTSKHQWK